MNQLAQTTSNSTMIVQKSICWQLSTWSWCVYSAMVIGDFVCSFPSSQHHLLLTVAVRYVSSKQWFSQSHMRWLLWVARDSTTNYMQNLCSTWMMWRPNLTLTRCLILAGKNMFERLGKIVFFVQRHSFEEMGRKPKMLIRIYILYYAV